MRTDDFDYVLPPERIAQHPLPRGASRLLVLDGDTCKHQQVSDLPELLQPGDLLVVNNTRVIPARLFAQRPDTGGRLELLLLEPDSRDSATWTALAKPAKKAPPGRCFQLLDHGGELSEIELEIVERGEEGRVRVRFSEAIEPYLQHLGHVPLPPYIQRCDDEEDRERYQTVYARHDGSVAAPTAGLHLSESLLEELAEAGVQTAEVTLHVGIGTFRPVNVEKAEDHQMDAERYEISEVAAAAIERTRREGGKVVAVGTTVVRTLESAAREDGTVQTGTGSTRLYIRPGFEFRVVDRLLTNFHLPKSTLLMLVSALAGRERVLAAYAEAVEREYRFYSYGDAMLVGREG